eukprot:3532555-Rhodomonas_salina.1
MLEPSPTNRNEAMRNVRLSLFWIDSEKKEMDGLWKCGCLRSSSSCNLGADHHFPSSGDGFVAPLLRFGAGLHPG